MHVNLIQVYGYNEARAGVMFIMVRGMTVVRVRFSVSGQMTMRN